MVAVELLVVLGLFAVVVVGGAEGGAGTLIGAVGQDRDLPGEAGSDHAVRAGRGRVVRAARYRAGAPQRGFTTLTLDTAPTRGPPNGRQASTASAKQTLTTTWHHPFWDVTHHRWTDAHNLTAGTRLRTMDGITVTVAEVRNFHHYQTTYDLTVGTLHTYYVLAGQTPILVHNCNDGYADVYFDDVEKHASNSVTHGDTTIHTEAGSRPGSDSVPGMRSKAYSPGTIVVRVPLSDAKNAQLAQYAMEDVNLGPHDIDTNNCVTYCARILKAGGVDIPANDSQNIAGWLLNSSHPQRRL